MALRFCLLSAALVYWTAAPASGQQAGVTIVQPGAPGESGKILTPADVSKPPRGPAEADVKFMQGMIMHHSQAVEMTALLRTHGHSKALQELGKRISISQTDEIKYMKDWLADRGQKVPTDHDQMMHMGHMDMSKMDMSKMDHGAMSNSMDMGSMPMMPGMLTPEQMSALAKANGAAFDHLFLTGMIQHHTGALIMVQDLFDTPGAGQDNQLYDFATDVDNTQRAEIHIMQGMLSKEKK